MNLEEINHLLELARIEIEEEEKIKLSKELESVLNYVKKLNEVNTENVEPMTGGSLLENVCREDEIKPQKYNLQTEGYFKVPPIFE